MTPREMMLAAIRGRATARIPFAPRLDLWFRANRRAGTLPAKYRKATLEELIDDLGWGYHAVIPDYRDLRSSEDDIDRALGIYNIHTMPCRTVLEEVRRVVRVDGDRTHVEYVTPTGSVSTTTVYDESMRAAGITITHVEERAFKDARDYEALGWIFEHARVESNAVGYDAFAGRVGDRGVAVGYVTAAGSPMHLLLREIMPFDVFFYECVDRPDAVKRLAGQVGRWFSRMTETAAGSSADVLLLGANWDASMTNPPFFAEHVTPWMRPFADRLHARGKFLLSHTDGENTGLLGHYLDARIDVADSICPAPMTKRTFREVRETFAGRVTIMGGIPSVALLKESMPDAEFERFLDDFFASIGRGDRLILGISDTTPPAAEFERIVEIARRVEQFGPVRAEKP